MQSPRPELPELSDEEKKKHQQKKSMKINKQLDLT